MSDQGISPAPIGEHTLAGVTPRPAPTFAANAMGSEALPDLLAKLDQARNEFRALRLDEAHAALTGIAATAQALAAAPGAPPGLDAPQIALVGAAALLLRGRTGEQAGRDGTEDWKRAVELFDRYVPQTTPSAEMWGYYGAALRLIGRRKDAITALRTAFKEGTQTPELYRHLGWALKDEGEYQEAEQQLLKALELAPSDTLARRVLAETLLAQHRNQEAAAAYGDAALLLARSGDLPSALTLVDHAIAADDHNAHAFGYRGEILRLLHRNREDLENALAAFDRSLQLKRDEVWVLAGRGETLFALGRTDQALAAFDEALTIASDDGALLESKGHILYTAADYHGAIAVLRRAISFAGASVTAYTELAEALIRSREFDDALRTLALASERFPGDAGVFGLRGEAFRMQGRFEESLACFEDSLAKDPGFAYSWASKAASLHALRRLDEAHQAFERALALQPNYTWALVENARVLQDLGKTEAALDMMQRAVASDPNSVSALASLARALESAGRLEEAVVAADGTLALHGDDVDALLIRGESLRRLCRFEQALETLNQLMHVDHRHVYALGTRGQVLRAMARDEEAVTDFQSAHAAAPAAVGWILEELSDCLEHLNRRDEAEEARDQVLAIEPKDTYSSIAKAEVLAGRQQHDEAIKMLKAVLTDNPHLAIAHEVLGRVLSSQRQFEPALAALDQAIALEPTDMLAIAYRGQVLRALQRKSEAAEALERAIRLNPYLDWPTHDLTAIYRDLNQPEKALPALDLVETRSPRPVAAKTGKGMVFCDISEYAKAITVIDQAISLQPSCFLYALKGWALEYSGRIPEALAAYQKGFEIDSQDLWNRRGVADCLRHLGRQEEADDLYQSIIDAQAPTISDPWGLSLIGWCHYGRRQYEDAVDYYSEALALDGSFVSGQFDLSLIMAASRRFGNAGREYERAFQLAAAIGPLSRRGFLHVALTDLQLARKVDADVAGAPEIDAVVAMLQQKLQQDAEGVAVIANF